MSKLLLVAAALAAAIPLPAIAQTLQAAPSVHIRYTDLDLATPAGQRELDRRIAHAAFNLCPLDWHSELARRSQATQCLRDVKAQASAQRDRAVGAALANRGPTQLAAQSTSRAD